MKIVGWIMAIVAGLIILYNVATFIVLQQIAKENPSDPRLTSSTYYTFMPPYTGFELTVIVVGVIGIVIITVAPSKE